MKNNVNDGDELAFAVLGLLTRIERSQNRRQPEAHRPIPRDPAHDLAVFGEVIPSDKGAIQ